MGGKGELVEYHRLFKQGPLTQADKDELKSKINSLIDGATFSITLEAMIQVPISSIITETIKKTEEELKKK